MPPAASHRAPSAAHCFILYCVVARLPIGGRGAAELCGALSLRGGPLARAELERMRTLIAAQDVATYGNLLTFYLSPCIHLKSVKF